LKAAAIPTARAPLPVPRSAHTPCAKEGLSLAACQMNHIGIQVSPNCTLLYPGIDPHLHQSAAQVLCAPSFPISACVSEFLLEFSQILPFLETVMNVPLRQTKRQTHILRWSAKVGTSSRHMRIIPNTHKASINTAVSQAVCRTVGIRSPLRQNQAGTQSQDEVSGCQAPQPGPYPSSGPHASGTEEALCR